MISNNSRSDILLKSLAERYKDSLKQTENRYKGKIAIQNLMFVFLLFILFSFTVGQFAILKQSFLERFDVDFDIFGVPTELILGTMVAGFLPVASIVDEIGYAKINKRIGDTTFSAIWLLFIFDLFLTWQAILSFGLAGTENLGTIGQLVLEKPLIAFCMSAVFSTATIYLTRGIVKVRNKISLLEDDLNTVIVHKFDPHPSHSDAEQYRLNEEKEKAVQELKDEKHKYEEQLILQKQKYEQDLKSQWQELNEKLTSQKQKYEQELNSQWQELNDKLTLQEEEYEQEILTYQENLEAQKNDYEQYILSKKSTYTKQVDNLQSQLDAYKQYFNSINELKKDFNQVRKPIKNFVNEGKVLFAKVSNLEELVEELDFPDLYIDEDVEIDTETESIEEPIYYYSGSSWKNLPLPSKLSPISNTILSVLESELPEPKIEYYAPRENLAKCLVLNFNKSNTIVYFRDEEYSLNDNKWIADDEKVFKNMLNQMKIEGINILVFTAKEIVDDQMFVLEQIKNAINI